jgi:hypothetical protein
VGKQRPLRDEVIEGEENVSDVEDDGVDFQNRFLE